MYKNPALVIGLAISVLTVVLQGVTGELAWEAAIPAVTGLLVRFFVYSPQTYDEDLEMARRLGGLHERLSRSEPESFQPDDGYNRES